MKWKTVIGLEVHVELSTETKIFCSCSTRFGASPNTQCCPICTGMPGTLPTLNAKVLEYAIKAGVALNCEITRYNKFDRKNYFYPDLPKAYQISQLYLPFARNGRVDIGDKIIRIHEIHMEEDAGKLIHSEDTGETFIDYNRCGVPLLEIVSEPDFESSDEVIRYLEQLKSTFEYLGISDVKMQEGSLRADVNLSVMPADSSILGVRTEMKNINSFKAIEHAIAYEAQRQISVLESGGKVIQETRRWDDSAGISLAMRSKEDAHDYRYFPEPDIPPISISEEMFQRIKSAQPELAHEKKKRYQSEYNLTEYESSLLTINRNFAILFESTVDICNEPKETANWMLGSLMRYISENSLGYGDITLSPSLFARFITVIRSGKINRNVGKDVFVQMLEGGDGFDIDGYIEQNGLAVINDENAVKAAVKRVFAANPKTVEQYLAGKTKVTGFLVGQVMREFKGKADAETVSKAVLAELANSGN